MTAAASLDGIVIDLRILLFHCGTRTIKVGETAPSLSGLWIREASPADGAAIAREPFLTGKVRSSVSVYTTGLHPL